ncbi:MAG TPA: hypothetical protein VJT72_04210 [Pseudonocardiaceae bacterium]|nr:hypothetical protein [Pseudonocardiaceae bacterium]
MTGLHRQVRVSYLRDQGQLYLYSYHSGNTFSAEHHAELRIRSLVAATIAEKELLIRASMAHFAIYGPIQVCGHDGPEFSIEKGVA